MTGFSDSYAQLQYSKGAEPHRTCVGTGMVNFQAPLMGFSDDSFQTYLSMKFELPTELPPGIFLERYLKANFDV